MCQAVLDGLLTGARRATTIHGWGAAVALTAAILFHPATGLAGQLALGRDAGRPGQTVTLPLTYRQGTGTEAAGLATDILFKSSVLTHPRCTAGSVLSRAAKTVTCAEPQPGLLRVAVYGLNLDPVPDGDVATLTFDVAPGARRGLYLLRNIATGADAQGTDFPLAHRNGAVRVSGP
jgi:hypothetical protein